MKKLLPVSLIGMFFLVGCASLHWSGDPIVITAETTTQSAMDVFDTFLQFEYSNRGYLQKIVPSAYPQIHAAAEKIRRYGIGWLNTARNLTKAYKTNRTPENKAQLTTALAVLQSASTEAQNWMTQLSTTSAPSPTPQPQQLFRR